VNDSFQVKDALLTAYHQKVLAMLTRFKTVKIEHILRSDNVRADTLSKLALGKGKGRYGSIFQLTLNEPSVLVPDDIEKSPVVLMADWREPIRRAIKSMGDGELVRDRVMIKKASRYVLIRDDLCKRGFSTPY